MTGGGAELSELAARLAELADRLGDAQTPDEEAVKLAREAAEISVEAGQRIDSAVENLAERGGPDADAAPPSDPAT